MAKPLGLPAAALLSLILTMANLFTVFLPGWSLGLIRVDPAQFAFAIGIYLGGQFFTNLVALLGISAYLGKA